MEVDQAVGLLRIRQGSCLVGQWPWRFSVFLGMLPLFQIPIGWFLFSPTFRVHESEFLIKRYTVLALCK